MQNCYPHTIKVSFLYCMKYNIIYYMKKNILYVLIIILLATLSYYTVKIYKQNKSQKVVEHLVINTQNSDKFGKYLTDSNNMTLYINIENPTSDSACDYNCMKLWKPFIVDLAYGGDESFLSKNYNLGDKISIIKRSDGLFQYAYDGKLLYRYITDQKAGDVYGLNIFGKEWTIINI